MIVDKGSDVHSTRGPLDRSTFDGVAIEPIDVMPESSRSLPSTDPAVKFDFVQIDLLPPAFLPGPFSVERLIENPDDLASAQRIASGGFRPRALEDRSEGADEPIAEAHQSAAAAALVAGLFLAALFLLLGLR